MTRYRRYEVEDDDDYTQKAQTEVDVERTIKDTEE